jgi:O-antigen ligase
MNKARWNRREKIVVILLLFLLPTQLAYHFWPDWSFVFGIRIDLLAPTIYLTDILTACLLFLELLIRKEIFVFIIKYKFFLLFFVAFVVVNSFLSTSPQESFYRWLKITEYLFIFYYFSKQKVVKPAEIVKTFFCSAILFSVIGVIQFIEGKTIGGILYVLGERNFNQSTPGIALVSLNGVERLRAYSTFPHPNSLAGFMGASVLFILLSGKIKRNLINFLGITIILFVLVTTFSVGAYLGIFLIFSFFLFSRNTRFFKTVMLCFLFISIIFSLMFPIFLPIFLEHLPHVGQSISQRLDLGYIAGQIISQNFWIGRGLGTFIMLIPDFKGLYSYSWLLQPVHNIFLLIFSETGIFGFLAVCYLFYKTILVLLKNNLLFLLIPITFIIFTGLFDHYSLTIQQNGMILAIFLGMSFRNYSSKFC